MDYQQIKSLIKKNKIKEALLILARDKDFTLDKGVSVEDDFTPEELEQIKNLLPRPNMVYEYINFLNMLFYMTEGKNLAYNLTKGLVKFFPNHPEANYFFSCLNSNVGNYPLAEKHILKAIEIEPNNAEHYSGYGIVKLKFLGDKEGAFAQFKKALKIDPNLLSAHYNLAVNYKLMNAYEAAEYHLRKASEIDPKNWMVIFELAVFVLFHKKDEKEFLMLLEQFKKEHPENPYLENLYYYKESMVNKNEKEAWNHMENFIELAKKQGLTPPAVISGYASDKPLKRFRKLTEEMIKAFPDDPSVLNERGLSLFWEGKFDEAAEFYQKAINISPLFIEVKINYLNLLLFRNRIEEAKKLCCEILEISPDSMTARLSLSLISLKENKMSDARQILGELHEIEEIADYSNFLLSFSYMKESNYVEAEKYSERTISDDFTSFPFRFNCYLYGKILFHNKKYQESREYLKRFIESWNVLKSKKILVEPCSEAYHYIGLIYYYIDKFKEAKENIEHAIRLKKDKRYFNDFSVVLTRLRKFWSAHRFLKEALKLDEFFKPAISNKQQLELIIGKLKRKYYILVSLFLIGIIALFLGQAFQIFAIPIFILILLLVFSKKPKLMFELKHEQLRFEFSEEYDFSIDEKAIVLVLSSAEEEKLKPEL